MTLLDEPILASIDSVLDDDHFVCCQIADNFSGVTTGFCGAPVLLDDTDQEYVEEVGCQTCNVIAQDDNFCPLYGVCDG